MTVATNDNKTVRNNYEVEVPFFCGFYESSYLNSDTGYDEIAYMNDEELAECFGEGAKKEDLEFDTKAYMEVVCERHIEVVEKLFKEYVPNVIKSMDYSALQSPQYYNYSTDRLFAKAVMEEGWKDRVVSFIKEQEDWLAPRVELDWTSYDGFLSHMDNTYEKWLSRFEDTDEPDWLYLSVMLGYMLEYHYGAADYEELFDSICNDTMDGVCASAYFYVPKKEEEKEKKEVTVEKAV